jgi:hypothetical protein
MFLEPPLLPSCVCFKIRNLVLIRLVNDMAGQYGVAAQNVQVISLDAIPASKTRRANTKQFHV